MSPYTPDEPATTLFLERTFVSGDVITGTGYGIQLVLYLGCARFLWSQRRKGRMQPLFLLIYITVLVVVETIYVAVQARTIQDMYVDNRNYPGGPWAYFLATQYLPENVLFIATLFTLTFLSDTLVLWRCWVIWTASGRRVVASLAIAFPTLCLLASFVVGALWAQKSSQPGLSLYSQLPVVLGTSYYALSLGVNILLTLLIAARLLAYRRRLAGILPGDEGRDYTSLAAIFVESAALYTVCAFAFLVTYAVNSPMNQVFLGMTNTGQQIATYLIIYRVAEGKGFGKSALEQSTFATNSVAMGKVNTVPLAFNRRSATRSDLETTVDSTKEDAFELPPRQ
ncbi:hypothetical protein EXIGLDRAFT_834996 [Exidia glandulosa HHB12029]|uniref:Family A G protein-coupled receptor-like protein n=1 Tax=Exidia glandulosa HHB12029 TaxID=1314781 RepID=A0A165J8E5_EXIGL|nr:hypothetical protein EXIGLDRAFT_834996 [Exidia glandulosa HHB12029]